MNEASITTPMLQQIIQRVLPHRYPFLLVDQVTELVPGQSVTGIKTFTGNESFSRGHFPGMPIIPVGILLEMCVQVGAVLVLQRPSMEGKVAMILQIPSGVMHALVKPGDTLRAVATPVRLRDNYGELAGSVYRGNQLVAEGRTRFAIADAQAVMKAI
jgi:3-hydroxyacyl-[acyl-carrier-protein] dehydratase